MSYAERAAKNTNVNQVRPLGFNPAPQEVLTFLVQSQKSICRRFFAHGACDPNCDKYHPKENMATVAKLRQDLSKTREELMNHTISDEETKAKMIELGQELQMYKDQVESLETRASQLSSELYGTQTAKFTYEQLCEDTCEQVRSSMEDILSERGDRFHESFKLVTEVMSDERRVYNQEIDKLTQSLVHSEASLRASQEECMKLKSINSQLTADLTQHKARERIVEVSYIKAMEKTIEKFRTVLPARIIQLEKDLLKKDNEITRLVAQLAAVKVCQAPVKLDPEDPAYGLPGGSKVTETPLELKVARRDVFDQLLASEIKTVKAAAPVMSNDKCWQWESSPGVWTDFDYKTNEFLIKSNRNGVLVAFPVINGTEYEVDLLGMTQTNKKTGTQRKIRLAHTVPHVPEKLPTYLSLKASRFNIPNQFIDPTKEEMDFIMNRIRKTWNGVCVKSIKKYVNKNLTAKYQLTKLSFTDQNIPLNEVFAFHGTHATDPKVLINSGASTLYANDGYLGRAFYLSERFDYVDKTYVHRSGNDRMMLGVYALLGNMKTEQMMLRGSDIRGNAQGYNSRSFTADGTTMYGLYDPTQVLCCYLITY